MRQTHETQKPIHMKPIEEFKTPISHLFTDIDDTLTNKGRLQKEAFVSLWRLHESGIQVVPVTGRPAGWCELIARQWPVAGVIGENGGLYFTYKNRQMKRYFALDSQTRQKNHLKLRQIEREILQQVPGAAVASDQFSRLMDLAIDCCEDVPPLNQREIHQIVAIFEKHGATAKVSSIHVNGWFGEYNKLSTCQVFCSRELQMDFDKNVHQFAYVGDSPNDEPMFQAFPNSFGVANIQGFVNNLTSLPQYVSAHVGGLGFTEIADKLRDLRAHPG